MGEPLLIHEGVPIFKVLELFKQAPVRLAVVVDEYGGLEGIVTQADLLEALAGDLPDDEGDTPDIVERDDGSLLIDGMAPVHGVLGRLVSVCGLIIPASTPSRASSWLSSDDCPRLARG